MDAKIAGLLSELAYSDNGAEFNANYSKYSSRLAGWSLLPDIAGPSPVSARNGYPATGTNGAFTIFINTTTHEIAFAFKGSNTFDEWVDDIFFSGRRTIGTVVPRAIVALNNILEQPAYEGYSVSAAGHSLGGAEAQTFALNALSDASTVVNSYYFNSLPISSTLIQENIVVQLRAAGFQVSSAADVVQLYRDFGGHSQGVYYGGEIADLRFRTIGGGTYLNSQLAEVSSGTNILVTLALTLLIRAGTGPIGLLAGFLGIRGDAHRMGVLNDAMQSMGVDAFGDLVAPSSTQPSSIPEGSQARSRGPNDTVVLADGHVASLQSDGSMLLTKRSNSGTIIDKQIFNTLASTAGSLQPSWSQEVYDESGKLATTRTFSQISSSQVQYVETVMVDGLPVRLAYKLNIDAGTSVASVPSQDELWTNLVQAKSAIYGSQALDDVAKLRKLAEYFAAAMKAEKSLTAKLAGANNTAVLEQGEAARRAFEAKFKATVANALSELTQKLAGADPDLYGGALLRTSFDAAEKSLESAVANRTYKIVQPLLIDARDTLASAGERPVLGDYTSSSPFDDPNFDPDAASIPGKQIGNGAGVTYAVHLPYRAGEGGERIKFQLTGDNANALRVRYGDQLISPVDGVFQIVVAQGFQKATFTLLALGNVAATEQVSISATLVDASGNATHQSHTVGALTITAQPAVPQTALPDIHGDLEPLDTDPNTSGVQIGYDDFGNVKTTANPAPDREDTLYGSDGGDHFIAGGGYDQIYADTTSGAAADWIEAGAGNDWVQANQGNDLVEGGAGTDVVFGRAGNDQIFGNVRVSVPDAIASGETDTATGQKGDFLSGQDGDDVVVGGADNDLLYGGLGNDLAVSGAGNDVINGDDSDVPSGPGGWSVSYNSLANDPYPTLDPQQRFPNRTAQINLGASGSSVSPGIGNGGDDQIYAGAGMDFAFGGGGSDYIDAGSGNDVVLGNAGSDVVYGGDGDDWIEGDDGQVAFSDAFFGTTLGGNDYLSGGAGDDVLVGQTGDDTLLGGSGNDVLEGDEPGSNYAGNDLLDGGDGDDVLYGEAGNDVLIGGAGNDVLRGGAGNDRYILGVGSGLDVIFDQWTNENTIEFDVSVLPGTVTAQRIQGTADLLIGWGANGDKVLVKDGLAGAFKRVVYDDPSELDLKEFLNSTLTTSIDLDPGQLSNTDGGITLNGGGGADTLSTGDLFGVTLSGNRGNDTLTVSSDRHNAETLEFSAGDGADLVRGKAAKAFIFDDTVDSTSAVLTHADPVDPSTLTPRDLVLTYSGTDLDGFSTTDTITIEDSSTSYQTAYVFDDGTTLSQVQLLERSGLALDWIGSEDDEVLGATKFDDSLQAMAGDDQLDGGDGNDSLDGGDGNDSLEGGNGDDTLAGGAGKDMLRGGAGDDTYVIGAGDGHDVIDDALGDNLVEFGEGITAEGVSAQLVNDTNGDIYLTVQYGDDHYVSIKQDQLAGDGTMSFRFADGMTLTDGELMTLQLDSPLDYIAGDNALHLFGSRFNDTILGSTQADFVDGGDGDDLIAGDAGADVLRGGEGDDMLIGNAGDDTLTGGDGGDAYRIERGMGLDEVIELPGDAGMNTLQLAAGVNAGDLSASRRDNDLYLHFSNVRDGVLLKDYYDPTTGLPNAGWQLRTADGDITPLSDIVGSISEAARPADIQEAMQRFEAKARDSYNGMLAQNGYRLQPDGSYRREDFYDYTYSSMRQFSTVRTGTTSQFDDDASIVRQSQPLQHTGTTTTSSQSTRIIKVFTGGATTVSLQNGGNKAKLGSATPSTATWFSQGDLRKLHDAYGVPVAQTTVISPIDGSISTKLTLVAITQAPTSLFTDMPITFTAYESQVSYEMRIAEVNAGASDNVIDGLPGYNVVDAGAGDDVIDARDSGLSQTPTGVVNAAGSPGSFLYGNAGADKLFGSAYDDVLIGGTGSDLMYGGAGNDTYFIFDGDGQDTIFDVGPQGIAFSNMLDLPDSATPQNLSVAWGEELYTDLGNETSLYATATFSWGTADSIKVILPHVEQNSGRGIDRVQFSDGASVTMSALLAGAPSTFTPDPQDLDNTIVATPDSVILNGYGGNDTLDAGGSAADLIGGAGTDTLIGGIGNIMYGGSDLKTTSSDIGRDYPNHYGVEFPSMWGEGDVYRSGAGSDIMVTNAGSDTFEYGLGDGYDVVTDMRHSEAYFSDYGGYYDANGVLQFNSGGDLLSPELGWDDPFALQAGHRAQLLQNHDTLKFEAGISPDDITVRQQYGFAGAGFSGRNVDSDLLIVVGDNTGSVRFENWFRADVDQLNRVEFADGTVWTRNDINSRILPSFHFHLGMGSQAIDVRSTSDVIVDAPIYSDYTSIGYSRDGLDLLISSTNGVDSLRLQDWYASPELASLVNVNFVYGGVVSAAQLTAAGLNQYGTEGADTLTGLQGFSNRLFGNGGDDILLGGSTQSNNSHDELEGDQGNDILEGGSGNDFLGDWSGSNLLEGRGGDDGLDSFGANFVAGGSGNDTAWLEGSSTMLAFNATDGQDLAYFFSGGTLSLGGGITAQNLTLGREGADLVLIADANNSLRLSGWYDDFDPSSRPATNLQIISGGVAIYDFNAILSQFDEFLALGINEWTPGEAALQQSLIYAGTDSAMGGAIAYQYAVSGSTDGLTVAQKQAVLNDPAFGVSRQSIGQTAHAPTVENPIADQSTNEDSAFSFTVPGGTFADADVGDTLTYSATLADGSALPSWLSFDAATGTFSGTPLQANVGSVDVRVRATDGGGLYADDTFALNVANVNDAPVISASASQTLTFNQTVDTSSLFTVSDEDSDTPTQYQFWDSTAGNGHFTVNGVEQGVNVAIDVSTADLANTQFVPGSSLGSDLVWVRANDGQAWGEWKSWYENSWPHATNAAPVVAASDATILTGQVVEAGTLFSVSDGDSDPITQYEFWDDVNGGGYWRVSGVQQAAAATISVAAADLANTEYVGAVEGGTERVWVRANDGMEWSVWKPWNMTTALHIPNAAPVVTASSQTVVLNQAVDASSLFNVSDADGDAITKYEFWDSTAGKGHFAVNGVEQGVNVTIAVSAADLSSTQFVGSATNGSDTVWVRANDGQVWSDWKSWSMASAPHVGNSVPVVSAGNATILTNQVVAADSLFSVTDGDNDPIDQYEFWDDVAGGGYWRLNGVQQGAAQTLSVSAADLANTQYVGGATGGTEQVWVRANDGIEWGAWKPWNMTTALHVPNGAPVVSAQSSQTVLLNQAVSASGLFSVSDADDDTITNYELWDSTAGGGHFAVNGVEQGVNVAIAVSASELSSTTFTGSGNPGSDLVWARANDGMTWSDWKSWTMQSSPHLTNGTPVVSAPNSGLLRNEAVDASDLFTTTDVDNDPIAQYEFWDDVNGGGYWRVNGVQQAAAQTIGVSAADLANTQYVGGANAGTEQVWVRANDGIGWGAWKNWLMSTEGGMLRGGAGPDTLNGDPNTPVLEGGAGDDTLNAGPPNSLLSGGAGDDALNGGAGNDILAGGAGSDTIDTGGGSNVIAFNREGGTDILTSPTGSTNTLSFGGGIGYDDLSLSKDGNDLVVHAGGDDNVVLKDWYAGNKTVVNMQVILDAMAAFDAGSSDPLVNKRVENFDFRGIVNAFDQALAQTPGMTSWAVTNALLANHLSGSDDTAIGGDLAYWYGHNGGFTGIGQLSAQQVLGNPNFGSEAQTLRPFNGLQEGLVKLS